MEAILIPMTRFLGGFAVAVVAMVLKFKERDRTRSERMLLTEKGLEVPKELYQVRQERKRRNGYRAGRAWLLILGFLNVFVGLGVLIGIGAKDGIHEGLPGIIVALIGVGFLVSERAIRRLAAERDKEPAQDR
jgi:hypothetical protein